MEQFLGYLNLFTLLFGIALGVLLIIKVPLNKGVVLALILLGILSLRSWVYLSFQVDLLTPMVRFIGIAVALQLLIVYGLYLLIRWVFNPEKPLDLRLYHWVLPLFVAVTLGIPNLFLPGDFSEIKNVEDTYYILKRLFPIKLYVLLWMVQTALYLGSILKTLFEEAKSVKGQFYIKKLMVPMLLITASFVGVFLMFSGTFFSAWFFNGGTIWIQVSSLIRPVFMLGLLLVCYRHSIIFKPRLRLFEEETDPVEEVKIWRLEPLSGLNTKYPHSRYEDIKTVQTLTGAIDKWVIQEKPFRDPNFSLVDLADKVGLPAVHLRFIFQEFNYLTFNDYRNFCRVQDLESVFRDPAYKHLMDEAVGEVCVFGSKSAMFRAVRRHYNVTPQELRFRLPL